MRLASMALLVVLGSACGSSAPVCTPKRIGGDFCVPDAGAPGVALTLTVREQCASSCDTGSVSCQVSVDAGTVVLELVGQECFAPGTSCPDLCGLPTFPCVLPALAAGDYTVSSPSVANQTLHVVAGGTTSCQVPPP